MAMPIIKFITGYLSSALVILREAMTTPPRPDEGFMHFIISNERLTSVRQVVS